MKLAIFLAFILPVIASAVTLQNSDFESPPSNWRANSTSPFFPLDENSTIPGWTFEGAVQYVTAGSGFSLPQNGHGVLLGSEGKINQTFTANGEKRQYLMTFTLAVGGSNCKFNASLVVSAPDSSAQFSLTQKYGKQPWEVYGHQIGSWGRGESVNLVFQSQPIDADTDSTCWPVVDDILISTVGSVNEDKDNLLANGGFELGPSFPSFTNEGLLLDTEPSLTESSLQEWAITGTVKYIDSKSYFIPEGKSAVELVSGVSTGVQTAKTLPQASNYSLEFMLGDANDSCIGDFMVGVVAGSTGRNFTVHSNGTGSAKKYTMSFKGLGTSSTPIIFQSYGSNQRSDGVLCGPVVDAVALHSSSGYTSNQDIAYLTAFLLVTLLNMIRLL